MKDNTPTHRFLAGTFFTRVLLLLLLCALQLPDARAALLFYDDFDYTVGEKLGGTSSAPPWENGKDQFIIAAGSLDYPGLQASTGNRVNVAATSSNLDSSRTATGTWPSQTNGTLYASFLLKVQSTNSIAATAEGTSLVTISRTANGTQLLGINLLNNGSVKLGVLKYPSSSSTVSSSAFHSSGPGANLSADGSVTYLVVAKYEWVSGTANDVVTLWVNPATLGGTEDAGNKVSTSAGTDGTDSAGRITFSRGPNVVIDELRIGQSWAEVTPTGAAVVVSQPRITQAFFAPSGFVLHGTNGTPSGTYQVLSSTNLMLALNSWSTIATNLFDGVGNFANTNPVPGGASRNFYRLLLGGQLQHPVAPSIVTQPSSLAVLTGQTALFSVVASGSAPLTYQWYFTNALIAGANASTCTVTNAATNNVGAYQVVITNSAGSVTSLVATLNVVSAPATGIPDGYAILGTGTTGGAGGPIVTVNNFTDFEYYVDNDSGPYTVLVQGTINLGGSNVRVRDNKTIIGLGTNATLIGDLKVFGNNNVIIRNLTLSNPNGTGDNDGLTLQECNNVWVDHCTFSDCADGSLDISHGADWLTVSWCHFYYTDTGNSHRFVNLVGHSDNNAGQDAGKLHVTFHHNWWGQLCHERMPRVRFGRVHTYNNFYNSPGNNNCVRAALDSELLVENNYFLDVHNPWEVYVTTGTTGKILATNNILVGTSFSVGSDSSTILVPGTDTVFTPAYPYTLQPAVDIPAGVTNSAGAGKGPFAP